MLGLVRSQKVLLQFSSGHLLEVFEARHRFLRPHIIQLLVNVPENALVALDLDHSRHSGAWLSQLQRISAHFEARLFERRLVIKVGGGPLGKRIRPPFGELVHQVQLICEVDLSFRSLHLSRVIILVKKHFATYVWVQMRLLLLLAAGGGMAGPLLFALQSCLARWRLSLLLQGRLLVFLAGGLARLLLLPLMGLVLFGLLLLLCFVDLLEFAVPLLFEHLALFRQIFGFFQFCAQQLELHLELGLLLAALVVGCLRVISLFLALV